MIFFVIVMIGVALWRRTDFAIVCAMNYIACFFIDYVYRSTFAYDTPWLFFSLYTLDFVTAVAVGLLTRCRAYVLLFAIPAFYNLLISMEFTTSGIIFTTLPLLSQSDKWIITDASAFIMLVIVLTQIYAAIKDSDNDGGKLISNWVSGAFWRSRSASDKIYLNRLHK